MKTFFVRNIICRFIRNRLAEKTDRGEALAAREQRHLSTCPECRRHLVRESRLVADLRLQADRAAGLPGDAVRERILAGIAEIPQPERRPWPAVRGVRIATVAAGVAVLAMGVLVFFPSRDGAPLQEREATVLGGGFREAGLIVREAEAIRIDVYSEELDRLLADGRAGAQFVLSSLPVDHNGN